MIHGSFYLPRILLTQPWLTRSCREMSHGLTPWWASSTILWRTTSGSGRPFTKTPPNWFTPPCPETDGETSKQKQAERNRNLCDSLDVAHRRLVELQIPLPQWHNFLTRISAFLKHMVFTCWQEKDQFYLLRPTFTLRAILHLCNSNTFRDYSGTYVMGIRPLVWKIISQKLFLRHPPALAYWNLKRWLFDLRYEFKAKILSKLILGLTRTCMLRDDHNAYLAFWEIKAKYCFLKCRVFNPQRVFFPFKITV